MTAARDGIDAETVAALKRRPAAAHEARLDADGLPGRRRNGARRPADLSGVQARKARLALFAARLQQEARILVETLAVIGLPGAVLGAGGEPLAANKPFAALMPGLVREMNGRPRLTDPVADRQIGDALARLGSASQHATARTIPIRGSTGKAAAIAHLIAVRGAEHEPVAGICGIMIVAAVRPRSAPSPQLLERLFGLSPAEARVACGIASRQTIMAMAGNFGVSRETVRSQLKTVLAKTGAKRQLDLAVLLCGLLLPKA